MKTLLRRLTRPGVLWSGLAAVCFAAASIASPGFLWAAGANAVAVLVYAASPEIE